MMPTTSNDVVWATPSEIEPEGRERREAANLIALTCPPASWVRSASFRALNAGVQEREKRAEALDFNRFWV